MKFGKSLSNQIEETLPEWREKFLSYKELKKKLKLIEPIGGERPNKRARLDASVAGDGTDAMSKEEIDFERLLENELEKFNAFFVEKEEEYIIRLKVFFLFSISLSLIRLVCLPREYIHVSVNSNSCFIIIIIISFLIY
jgi:SPX domain protein involved in polyphosphate accumulation